MYVYERSRRFLRKFHSVATPKSHLVGGGLRYGHSDAHRCITDNAIIVL